MFIDDAYAHLYALSLSAQGKSSPNPNVAAAIYSAQGDLISDGIHDRTKSIDHAEVVAISKAGAAARGATIVISLEPCAHTGATPPCTQAIIDAGISKVVYAVSDPNPIKRFPSSITNWRDRISAVGSTERNYLPLWMRSVQDDAKQELGFVLAVPICYCNPGTSADILLNIKFSGFDFKNLDYTVDRYIIDSVTGYGSDKYLVFKNDRVTIT
jgi:pyrimidine deaminase RibD-like protein